MKIGKRNYKNVAIPMATIGRIAENIFIRKEPPTSDVRLKICVKRRSRFQTT